MTIRLSPSFAKDYRRLSVPLQTKLDKVIRYLAENHPSPGLRVRKMVNHPTIYEARLDLQYRITFEKHDQLLILRRVGTHAIYKQP
jgi:mRNA-degrading endonuclease RelE of RelBE toxin-antitoxin system